MKRRASQPVSSGYKSRSVGKAVAVGMPCNPALSSCQQLRPSRETPTGRPDTCGRAKRQCNQLSNMPGAHAAPLLLALQCSWQSSPDAPVLLTMNCAQISSTARRPSNLQSTQDPHGLLTAAEDLFTSSERIATAQDTAARMTTNERKNQGQHLQGLERDMHPPQITLRSAAVVMVQVLAPREARPCRVPRAALLLNNTAALGLCNKSTCNSGLQYRPDPHATTK